MILTRKQAEERLHTAVKEMTKIMEEKKYSERIQDPMYNRIVKRADKYASALDKMKRENLQSVYIEGSK